MGVSEDNGKIIGLVSHEGFLGEAYFNIDSTYEYLKADMFQYALDHLCSEDETSRSLKIYTNDFDRELEVMALASRFTKVGQTEVCVFSKDSIKYELPEGFRVMSLNSIKCYGEDLIMKVKRHRACMEDKNAVCAKLQ